MKSYSFLDNSNRDTLCTHIKCYTAAYSCAKELYRNCLILSYILGYIQNN